LATIKEVAQHAGVSVATVSRVVNNKGYVSDDLRQRVQDAMRLLDYKPSAVARSLRRQESLTIGVLVPGMHQPFFATLAHVIQRTLFERNYRTLMCSSEEDGDKETEYVDMLVRQRVDGAIIAPTGQESEAIKMISAKIPVVLVDRDLPHIEVNRILANNYQGGYDAIEHLINLGHRRIAIIGGPPYSDAMQQRTRGADQAMHDAGLAFDPALVIMSDLIEFDMGFRSALHIFKNHTPIPTAIFALNDVVAVGIMHAAAEVGLRLPDDLSVIGFDDIPLAQYMIPSLTTIAQPIYEMGERAAQLLLNRLATGTATPYESIELEMKLKKRASTAPPSTSF